MDQPQDLTPHSHVLFLLLAPFNPPDRASFWIQNASKMRALIHDRVRLHPALQGLFSHRLASTVTFAGLYFPRLLLLLMPSLHTIPFLLYASLSFFAIFEESLHANNHTSLFLTMGML